MPSTSAVKAPSDNQLLYIIRLICVAATFFLSSFITVLAGLIRPFNPKNGYVLGLCIQKLCFPFLGVEFELRGKERLDKEVPSIIVGNHQDNIDIFVYSALMNERIVYLGKKAVKWVPLFGQAFWLSGGVLIDRFNPQKSHAKMDAIEDNLKGRNVHLVMFPEGTRSRGKGLGPFKKGAFRTAINLGRPLLPIVTSSYHKNLRLKQRHPGKVIVEVMEPIPTKDKSLEDLDALVEYVRGIMLKRLEQLDQEIATHS